MKIIIYIGFITALLLGSCGEKQVGQPGVVTGDKDTTGKSGQLHTGKTLPDGEYQETYPDGKVKIQGEVKNGKRWGNWVAFYPNGTKQSECYYEDGKKNGKTATYYPNGRLRYIGYYKWDEPSSTWEFYKEDGTLDTSKEY